ncbi:MAG: radical SAM protein [Candidatus Firestonebacteria bacterium]|nr:radical SAM protein [Candidatus Firestonebacteria bacterium]
MSFLKKIAIGSSIAGAKMFGQRAPVILNWAVTGKCNLRCKHCYGSYGRVQNEELSFEEARKLVDDAAKAGTRRMTLEGGEPLVRPDICELIEYIHSKGIEMSICTNGVLLPKFAERIKDKIDLVVFSLDGIEERHDDLRGKESFKAVMEAADTAVKYGMRSLFFTCLIDENINDIDFVLKTAAEKKGSSAFNIVVSKLSGEKDRTALQKAPDLKLREAMAKIIGLKKKGLPVFYSEQNFTQALLWPDFNKERLYAKDIALLSAKQKKTLIPCQAGRHFCYVESGGNVYPCYQMVGLMQTGNVKTEGFKEAFKQLGRAEYCRACYNITLSELNLQCGLSLESVLKVAGNYLGRY